MSESDIFISYSREDQAAARHFSECFAREGFSVWWDAALRSGETFDEVIERELRGAKAVVVLWSPRSVTSRWVRAEATLADRRNKLVPAIIEACDRPIIFELTHASDLADWTGDTSDKRWQGLVSDLHRLIDGAGKTATAAEAEAAEATSKPKAGGSASGKPWPASLGGSDATPAPTSNIDAAMFGPTCLSDPQGADPDEPELTEDTDQTQFFVPTADGFDLFKGDEFHCLQLIGGKADQTRFVVSPLGLKIGRNAPADIVLSGSGISRAHCMIELADDRLRVLDLNSTNGTFVDDKRINRTAFLDIGSVLRVGDFAFRHEVHTRAEVQFKSVPVSPPKAGRGPDLRAAGIARYS